MRSWIKYLIIISVLISACNRKADSPRPDDQSSTLTIFSINDAHGQINNFSKVKYIVDKAETQGEVIVVSAGDLFSGNPVVDFISEKGYPMIDLMNRSGFDVAVLGNHEFDYGQVNLTNRIEDAQFDFICANADMSSALLPQTDPYVTITAGDLDVTFLGMVETSYTSGSYIPATHPYRLEGITFEPARDIIDNYATLKEDTDSDLLVLLSHLGTNTDYYMAENHPYMDIIIGGHSHARIDEQINDVYVYQCGSYLRYLGKISLTISKGEIISEEFELIDLNAFTEYDTELATLIETYNNVPELDEVIAYNVNYISSNNGLGCLYTDALRAALGTDISFQNGGGIRNSLDQGDVTVREIYEIDPFNNGARIYSMSVGMIRHFFEESGAGLHYSGVIFENSDNGILIKSLDGSVLADETILTVGVNDYIPAVYEYYFPSDPTIDDKTTAELIIDYLRNNPTIDYNDCNRYFYATK